MPKDSWRTASRSYRDAVRRAQPQQPPRRAKPPRLYVIPAGTECRIKKQGESRWRPYKTRAEVVRKSFSWRNATHHGFRYAGYEIMVENRQFRRRGV